MKKAFVKRAVHLDFHTMPGVYDVGVDFNPDEFAATLKNAHVEYITVFARCNLGFAYYPTKIGVVHPGLRVKDLLGEIVGACRKKDIKTAAYFNAGLDHEHALRRREWCKVDRSGAVADMGGRGHYFRKMCLNTGYREHLLGMVEEVIEGYPVDGIFLDCFNLSPCYGAECLEGMKKLGMDITDENEMVRFCWRVTEQFAQEAEKTVKRKRKGASVYFNGLPYSKQPDHIELEVLPTGGWGYDYLPWAARYVRTLKKPFLTMTGRFHKSWGDFGGLRTEESLKFDFYNSIVNGGGCSLGDHMHPRGKLEPAVYALAGKVFSEIRKAEPYVDGAKPVKEMLIIEPALAMYPGFGFDYAGVAGAARMLAELKYQFDVSDGQGDISGYKAIILPDHVLLDGPLTKKLESHLSKGGVVVSSAFAGLDREKKGFALKEYKISFEGEEKNHPSFFKAAGEISGGLPDMLTAVYRQGAAIKAKKGARVLCRLYMPYFNYASWDMFHENLYTPPEKDTGRPALIQCGSIFHFSFPLFSGYFKDAVVAYRTLLGNCLRKVYPEPMVKVGNAPSFTQVVLAGKGTSKIVHILSYLPELRGEKMLVIEEPVVLCNIRLGLRKNGREIKKACLAPSGLSLKVQDEGGYAWVDIPEIKGYQMVVFS